MKLKTLYSISKTIYGPQKKYSVYRDQCRFCFRYIASPGTAKAMQSMQNDKNIRELFKLRPKIYDQPMHPHVCADWDKKTRLRNLYAHFNFMSTELGKKCKEVYSEQGYKLFSIQGKNSENYDVRLYMGEWREGGLGLAITNELSQDIYFTTFNITENRDLFIGCVQGSRGKTESLPDIIKSLTKAQHGMRPKALIVELTLMFARHFGIRNVYCVTNKGHVYSASRFRTHKQRKKVFFDYDAFCTELKGEKHSKYRFKLPLDITRRDLSTLNRTKRKMYCKRYELLDKYEQQMAASLSSLR
ncbi:VirK/YbjX family protein [Photobacterium kasasachensis]|uniref:VirK/YbjX family protein n=1 Tax=Photobacterium kasasachensis TaxID=2910240 RepID=UPI003D0C7236